MKLHRDAIDEMLVKPGKPADLDQRSTSEMRVRWPDPIAADGQKQLAQAALEALKGDLAAAQELLYATHAYALLVIFQAPDAAGKDGTIKHVMSGVNPQGCSVTSFKTPSAEEQAHDFLWRCARVLPEKGRIGIFNRSYYEEVLVTRVHPEVLADEHLPPEAGQGDELWKRRFEDINAFEHHLTRNGTRVVKFFLHVSKEEQKKRLLQRLEDPRKHWKFSTSDIEERADFDDYRDAYEALISTTSTSWAPWYVVPADHKYAMRALVAGVLAHTIEELDLHLPEVTPERSAELARYKQALLTE